MLCLLAPIFLCVSVALRGEKQCCMSNKDFSSKPLTTNAQLLLTNASTNRCTSPDNIQEKLAKKNWQKNTNISQQSGKLQETHRRGFATKSLAKWTVVDADRERGWGWRGGPWQRYCLKQLLSTHARTHTHNKTNTCLLVSAPKLPLQASSDPQRTK